MGEMQDLSPKEYEFINNSVQQIVDTYKILNTTIKPDVFFKRLNFLFDVLMTLQVYEKYGVFTENTPTKRINDINTGLEARVSRFVDRYMAYTHETVSALKTKKGKEEKYADLVIKLISAFDCANTFWLGSKGFPHYTGRLYTENNYQKVQEIYDEMCDNDFEDFFRD